MWEARVEASGNNGEKNKAGGKIVKLVKEGEEGWGGQSERGKRKVREMMFRI